MRDAAPRRGLRPTPQPLCAIKVKKMDAPEYISLGAVFVAVVALAWQVHLSNAQSKMQTFLTYTQRYQDIVINLPIGVESESFSLEGIESKDREEILRWLRAYFDLCSEEYYLNKNNLVDARAWRLWESGMTDSLQKPAFVEGWRIIQSNKYFHHEFANYIQKRINLHSNA